MKIFELVIITIALWLSFVAIMYIDPGKPTGAGILLLSGLMVLIWLSVILLVELVVKFPPKANNQNKVSEEKLNEQSQSR